MFPEVECTDGGALIRVAGQEIDLTPDGRGLGVDILSSDEDEVAATIQAMREARDALGRLATMLPEKIAEINEQIAEALADRPCEECDGSGTLEAPDGARSFTGADVSGREYDCPLCGGTGKQGRPWHESHPTERTHP